MIIETARLALRPPQLADATALAALMSEDVSRWTASWPYPLSAAAAAEKLRETLAAMEAARGFARMITRRDDGIVMGWLASAIIDDIPVTGSLGYWLGTAFHRQGFLSEALPPFMQAAIAALGLARMETGVQSENAASIALLKKLGMRFIGRRRHYIPARAREEDADFYAVDFNSEANPSR